MTRQRIFAGTRLRQVRLERGLRQAEFAETLGISASYLSQIEHDDRPLTPALLDRLQRLFPLNSIVRKCSPSISPMSYTRQTFGCETWRAMRTSA